MILRRIVLTILVLLFSVSLSSAEVCLWVWSTDIDGATADGPDSVWCNVGASGSFNSMGASHAIQGRNNPVTVTWDTATPDGAATIASLITGGDSTVLCNNANSHNLHVLAGATTSQFSAGGVYYHTESSLADGDANTFRLSSAAFYKFAVTEATDVGAGCIVVWTNTN